jgi:hypothetical protein
MLFGHMHVVLKPVGVRSDSILERNMLFSPFNGVWQSSWSVACDPTASSSAIFCLNTSTMPMIALQILIGC